VHRETTVSEARGAAFVTGVSTGIGAATVQALLARGYRVFGTVRRARDAAAVQAAGATPVICDVSYPPGITRARDTVERELRGQPLRALVNNAGIPAVGPIELVEMETVRRVLDVNVLGVVAVTQAFLPLLRAARGRIVNVSSVSARLALPFNAPYAASKFALEGLSDSLRRELAPVGVGVTVIQPGSVQTAIWDKIAAVELERFAGSVYEPALRRLRELALRSGARGIAPEVVAAAIVRALDAPRAPVRILVTGRDRLMQRLIPFLPARLLDRLVARQIATGRAGKKEKREE
jgi:NAD(P)-dependent dehydrogenase (short-subunit alcohol dehydrogenase family)